MATKVYGMLLAAVLGACSTGAHDGAMDGTGSGGGAGPPLTGGSGAGVGTGGVPANTGMGSGGSVAIGSGGVGGGAGAGAGGASASGTGGVQAMPLDAGADTASADAAVDAGRLEDAGTGAGGRGAEPPFATVYRIALRVHRGDSALSDDELLGVLDEMNWIWWSQAAICFEIEIVADDQILQTGFDFWFHKSDIPCSPGANGVYCGDHDIHTLDDPDLGPVDDPAWDTVHDPSRTSAHELGHGLSLEHYNGHPDSNDSLMSSGRRGFKLHDFEIDAARTRADQKKLDATGALHCAVPTL